MDLAGGDDSRVEVDMFRKVNAIIIKCTEEQEREKSNERLRKRDYLL